MFLTRHRVIFKDGKTRLEAWTARPLCVAPLWLTGAGGEVRSYEDMAVEIGCPRQMVTLRF